MRNNHRQNTFISKPFERVLVLSMIVQLPTMLFWGVLHLANINPAILFINLFSSALIATYGVALLKNSYRLTAAYPIIVGVIGLILTTAGAMYVIAPLAVHIPLLGPVSIIYSNLLLGTVFASLTISLLLLAVSLFAAKRLFDITKNPRE